jgi:hypothetical protein
MTVQDYLNATARGGLKKRLAGLSRLNVAGDSW